MNFFEIEGHSQTENRFVVVNGEGAGTEIDGKFQLRTYELLYIQMGKH